MKAIFAAVRLQIQFTQNGVGNARCTLTLSGRHNISPGYIWGGGERVGVVLRAYNILHAYIYIYVYYYIRTN